MKFGDKLVELRKKNGYSQEELAEKLGVSRQSVSKWESNNTYPETDKIIQIANLFDCTMDDLINDKVTDINSTLRKNKSIYNVWDSLLEFITKTINMFSRMTFSQGLRCVIEIIILFLLLKVIGSIICGSLSYIISNMFIFLKNSHVVLIRNILDSIFNLVWFIITIIILVYSFKIRYLNYYDIETEKENKKKINNNDETSDSKIIRNENEKPFAFLGVLSKIVIAFIKCFTLLILLGFLFFAIGTTAISVFMLFLLPVNILFLWLFFIMISSTSISILIIILLYNFIFERSCNLKLLLTVFIISIIVFGVGLGLSFISFKNIDFIDDNSIFNYHTEEINLEYKDNLVIKSDHNNVSNKYKYIIDNNLEDNQIIVSREIDSKYYDLDINNITIDKLPVSIVVQNNKNGFKFYYNFYINNLKKNKVYTFDNYGKDPLIIRANQNTINNLITNLKKLYLVDEKINNNEIDIEIYQDKVFFKKGLKGEYNGVDDTIKYDVDDYTCMREIESTPYGERIIYDCDYINEE